MTLNLNPATRGLIWVALGGLFFVVFVAIVRYIGSELHALETAFIRYALGIVVLTPLFLRHGLRPFRSQHISQHAIRGVIHAIAVMLWFYAATQIPLAEVTALSFISPIFVAIGASLFLGEQLTTRRIAVIIIGILGVMVILRPGIVEISLGAMVMLIAAPLFAASKLLTKSLVRYDSTITIVVYLSIFSTLAMAIPAWFVWQTPTLHQFFWLFGTAFFATLSHLCVTRGLTSVDVTVAQPVEFLQLVWSTLLGIIIFSEQPSLWVWIGAGIIVASASYIARYESRST